MSSLDTSMTFRFPGLRLGWTVNYAHWYNSLHRVELNSNCYSQINRTSMVFWFSLLNWVYHALLVYHWPIIGPTLGHPQLCPAKNKYTLLFWFIITSKHLALICPPYFATSLPSAQAVINSTISPSMTFTKTSQKFGQWSDVRANTVYGLGFQTEPDLNQVSCLQSIYSLFPLARPISYPTMMMMKLAEKYFFKICAWLTMNHRSKTNSSQYTSCI